MKHLAIFVLSLLLFTNKAFSQETFGSVIVAGNPYTTPVEGVKVTVKHKVPALYTVTDFDGIWKMEIPQGYDTLLFSHDGFFSEEIALGPDDRSTDLQISLQPTKLSGTVTNEYDEPIAGVTVMAMNVFPKMSTVTDAQGSWSLDAKAGIDNLKFTAEHYAPREVRRLESGIVKLAELEFPVMSPKQMLDYVNEGHNLNKPFGRHGATEFTMMFAGYFYHCLDSVQPALYRAVEVAKEPIKDAVTMLDDPCVARSKDIMEYFSLLVRFKHGVSEDDFRLIQSNYFSDWTNASSPVLQVDKQDGKGKTLLMYACEFGYVQSAKDLIKAKADASIKDNSGKRALDYAKANGNKELVALLK